MDNNPKRRKYQDNPYYLSKDESKNLYVIRFKDSNGVMQEVKVTKEVWDVFDEYEKIDLIQMNEFDRHTEHTEVYEEILSKRAKEKLLSIEDEFIIKTTFEELKRAIDMLPEVQRRRIKKYYFDDINEIEMAKQEKTSHQAIHKSIILARKKLKEILKNL